MTSIHTIRARLAIVGVRIVRNAETLTELRQAILNRRLSFNATLTDAERKELDRKYREREYLN
jgi:hypothetical protein